METFKQKYSSSLNIFLATVLFVLYVFVVFSIPNPVKGHSIPTAEQFIYDIQYAQKIYPAFAIYTLIILKNILNVKNLKWLIYPIIIIVLNFSLHMIFVLAWGTFILWFGCFTIPLNFRILIQLAFGIEGYKKSLNEKSNVKLEETLNVGNDNKLQKKLNIIGYIVIPIFLLLLFISIVK